MYRCSLVGDANPGFNYRLDEHVRSVTARSFASNNPCQSAINYLQNDNIASPGIVRSFDNNLFANILEIGFYIDRQPFNKDNNFRAYKILIILISIHKSVSCQIYVIVRSRKLVYILRIF